MKLRWKRCYTGPGSFRFAIPIEDKVVAFTDHSLFIFSSDGIPDESIILDRPVVDAGKCLTTSVLLPDIIYAVFCGKLRIAEVNGDIKELPV